MLEQTLEEDIRDEAAYAQKYNRAGMASIDFVLLDEWAGRAALLEKQLVIAIDILWRGGVCPWGRGLHWDGCQIDRFVGHGLPIEHAEYDKCPYLGDATRDCWADYIEEKARLSTTRKRMA